MILTWIGFIMINQWNFYTVMKKRMIFQEFYEKLLSERQVLNLAGAQFMSVN